MPTEQSAQPWTVFFRGVWSHLHAVHGLSDLVQVVGGAKRLQADVCQLELLLPQLVLQLKDDFSLSFGAFAQPANGVTHREEEEGVTSTVIQNTHTHSLEWTNTHLQETVQREAGVSGENCSYNMKVNGELGHLGQWILPVYKSPCFQLSSLRTCSSCGFHNTLLAQWTNGLKVTVILRLTCWVYYCRCCGSSPIFMMQLISNATSRVRCNPILLI